MKTIRKVISIVLIVLAAVSVFMTAANGIKNAATNSKYIDAGDECVENKLYQKAINNYTAALSISDKFKVREKLVNAYLMSYKDGTHSLGDYANSLSDTAEKYPDKTEIWETLMQLYIDNNLWKDAYRVYNKSVSYKAKSDKIKELGKIITYSYITDNSTYSKVFFSPDGYTSAFDDNHWGVIGPDNEEYYEFNYEYLTPPDKDLTFVAKTSEHTWLYDNSGVVQWKIEKENITEARAAFGMYVPVKTNDGKWKYLKCDEGYVLNTYDDASSFQNGIAAVKQGGKWSFIKIDGSAAFDKTFEDVKLYGNGEYAYGGYFVARENGKYGLYSTDGKSVIDAKYKDMDLYMGSDIAVCDDNGKWGYVDIKGNTVIECQYIKAKSFSNGLAAVYNGTKWGFISPSNEVVIDYQYLDALYFTNKGACLVSIGEGYYNFIVRRFI